jgi:FSR family fosmidomycin resistance protein-like MFS transporter
VLVLLVFSKTVYMASLGSFLTFYLIHAFGVSVQASQLYLFLFLAGVVAGTLAGGAIGDRVGRVPVIWFSILGAAPFTLLLPHVGLVGTAVLSAVIGAIMASAFSAILVYAQDLVPGRVGMVSGLFFGLTFGLGGIGAAALGALADRIGIEAVYRLVAFLPLLGLLTVLLPAEPRRPRAA